MYITKSHMVWKRVLLVSMIGHLIIVFCLFIQRQPVILLTVVKRLSSPINSPVYPVYMVPRYNRASHVLGTKTSVPAGSRRKEGHAQFYTPSHVPSRVPSHALSHTQSRAHAPSHAQSRRENAKKSPVTAPVQQTRKNSGKRAQTQISTTQASTIVKQVEQAMQAQKVIQKATVKKNNPNKKHGNKHATEKGMIKEQEQKNTLLVRENNPASRSNAVLRSSVPVSTDTNFPASEPVVLSVTDGHAYREVNRDENKSANGSDNGIGNGIGSVVSSGASSGADTGSVYEELQDQLSQHWYAPVGVRVVEGCIVRVSIDCNGMVKDIIMVRESGILMYDASTKMACARVAWPQCMYGKELIIKFN